MKKEKIILPDWDKIAKILKYKEKDFQKLLKDYINRKNNIYEEIKNIKSTDRTFKNTILALENSDSDYQNQFNQIVNYGMTHKAKSFRDLANTFQKGLSEKLIEIEYDKDIYRSVMEYKNGNYREEKKNLDKVYGIGSQKLFSDLLKAYQRMGFNLPTPKQQKLKEIIKKLSKLSLDFSKNIAEYKDYILCNESEIEGLPENFMKTLEKVNGKYKITLEYPSLHPFLTYAKSRIKRKEITDKNYQKGGKENLKILGEMIRLRDQSAKLLEFKNFVDFNLENRMAKDETAVRKFVGGLIQKLIPASRKDLEELNTFAKNNLDNYKDIKKIDYYDISYVANKLKENKYNYDSSKIKEYFELERTLKVMFEIFGELFSFIATEVKAKNILKIKVDKDVRIYEFKDRKSKEIISYLILDLFPRDGKYGHACSSEFIFPEIRNSKRVIPVNQLICNFSKGNKKIPSLLTLGEVETLFHEFGHGLHFMFGKNKYDSQSGFGVVFDFVETPSQMLENFLFEENNLLKLSKHYQTGKSLDRETIEKIIKGKNFLNGYTYLRQNVMSLYDLDLYSNKVKTNDIAKYYISLIKKYNGFTLPKDNIFGAGFDHLTDYAAGYYSYMWALVYADDFYSIFKEAGNDKKKLKAIGERYREEILEVGGSREEMISVKKFLKRNPNNKAFLVSLK